LTIKQNINIIINKKE